MQWVCAGYFASLLVYVPGALNIALGNKLNYAFTFMMIIVGLGGIVVLLTNAAVARYAAFTGHLPASLCALVGVLMAGVSLGWLWPRPFGFESIIMAFSCILIVGLFLVLWYLVGLAVGIVLRGLLSGRVVRQTGRLCWGCGYSLVGLSGVGTCPECGRPTDEAPSKSFTEVLLQLAGFPRVWTLLGLALVGVVAYGVLWTRHELATQHQLDRLGSNGLTYRIVYRPSGGSLGIAPAGIFPDDSRADHSWFLLVRKFAPDTELQIQYGPDSHVPGVLDVYADLTAEQVARVLNKGWPEGMLEMVRTSFDDLQAKKSKSSFVFEMFVDVSGFFASP